MRVAGGWEWMGGGELQGPVASLVGWQGYEGGGRFGWCLLGRMARLCRRRVWVQLPPGQDGEVMQACGWVG